MSETLRDCCPAFGSYAFNKSVETNILLAKLLPPCSHRRQQKKPDSAPSGWRKDL
jgi:hypothetical protein